MSKRWHWTETLSKVLFLVLRERERENDEAWKMVSKQETKFWTRSLPQAGANGAEAWCQKDLSTRRTWLRCVSYVYVYILRI